PFNPLNANTISWFEYTTTCTPSGDETTSIDSALMSGAIHIRPAVGNWVTFDFTSGMDQVLATCVPNQWTRFDANFDNVAHPNQFRVAVNGGTYSSYFTVDGGSYTNMVGFTIFDANSDNHTLWIDAIGVNACAANQLKFTSQPVSTVAQGGNLGS